MPMIPSFLAAASYGAIKVCGYAGFARALNVQLDRKVNIWGFGFAKTAIGFAVGVAYFLLVLTGKGEHWSEAQVYAGVLPFRLLAWAVALTIFYRLRQQPRALAFMLLVAGVVWSYLLDGLMALVNKLPGMTTAFC